MKIIIEFEPRDVTDDVVALVEKARDDRRARLDRRFNDLLAYDGTLNHEDVEMLREVVETLKG